MKILMIAPDCQMIDRRILQEAEVLIGAGHEVTLLCGFECRTAESYRIGAIDVHRFVYDWDDERLKPVRSRLGRHPRLHRVVNWVFMTMVRKVFELTSFERFVVERALAFRADVVHCHDLPMLRSAIEVARRWDVPCVFDAHELYHAQEVLGPALRARLLRDEKELLPRCAAVITVNEFLALELHRIHHVPMPWVVYNSVEPPPLETVTARRGRLRAMLPGEGPIVLFQGWLSGERNIETMVAAMAAVPAPARLAVIGYGPHEATLRTIAAERGVADRVHFLGRVPSEEMLQYTVDADLGVIPYLPIDLNHRFCSPNKFFEFVLSGVPVLAHDLPFFRTMQRRHDVVRCGDLSTADSAAAAIRAAIDPAELARLRTNCLAARDRLAWSNDAAKLSQIYAALDPTLVAAGGKR
ncbi:MAG: glycosyltransferase [Planctomycetes bacterium]|nr:glycosyltransferase [Planctomycetota bacterium]